MHNFDSWGYLQNEIFEKFTINKFSLLRDNLFLRSIKYNNIEILKLISFLVRDKNWNNYSPEIIKTSSYNKDKKLHFELMDQNNFELGKSILKYCYKNVFRADGWCSEPLQTSDPMEFYHEHVGKSRRFKETNFSQQN